MGKPTIIEFTGHSGSGKSTYCNKVYHVFNSHKNIRMLNATQKRNITLKFLLFHPFKVLSIICLTIKLKPKRVKRYFKGLKRLIMLKSVYDYYGKHPAIYLEDEGYINKLRMLSYNKDKYTFCDIIQKVSKEIRLPNVLIYVFNTPENIVKNRKARDGVEIKSNKTNEDIINDRDYIFDCFKINNKINQNIKLFNVDNTLQDEFDVNVQNLTYKLRKIF